MLLIENLHKRFHNFIALESINLKVDKGEIVSLVGTSGCGKSTLLRIIASLDFPTYGTVSINNYLIDRPHPAISIIFQESRLMPWLTVKENVEFGLHDLPRSLRSEIAHSALVKVGLEKFTQLLPRQLSGGMAQRVSIARALVTQPRILLLDEPFSALDAFTRLKLQDCLLDIWADERPTMLLVTHDVEEALVLSDRVIVMHGHPGRIQQEFHIDLPRPRKRSDRDLQVWKEKLLNALDLSETENVIAKI